eukprot:Gb_26988 [translate_table: standard]
MHSKEQQMLSIQSSLLNSWSFGHEPEHNHEDDAELPENEEKFGALSPTAIHSSKKSCDAMNYCSVVHRLLSPYSRLQRVAWSCMLKKSPKPSEEPHSPCISQEAENRAYSCGRSDFGGNRTVEIALNRHVTGETG